MGAQPCPTVHTDKDSAPIGTKNVTMGAVTVNICILMGIYAPIEFTFFQEE